MTHIYIKPKIRGEKYINIALPICPKFSTASSLKCQSEMHYWESSKKDKPHAILNVLDLKLKYCLQFKYSHSNPSSSLFIMHVQ